MTDKILIDRSVVEQALEALNATMATHGKREWIEAAKQQADATLRSALEQPQDHPEQHLDMVPTGWKLVPVELTDSQIRAAQDTWWHACNSEMYWDQIYAAMLAAAPQPPAGEKTQPEIDHAHELRRHSRKLGEPVGETAGVMQRAADEIERLRAMLAAAPQPKLYPLPDDLYGGSKDWRAGSYAERVEWLHLMYEGAKEEIERLGQTQGEQEQPKRDPLSDEQILKLGWAVTPYANQMEMLSIARAIERAHGIGGKV